MRLRPFAAWCLFAVALVPWILSFLVSPFDTMGTSAHNIRSSVAEKILDCAIASVVLLLLSGILLFAKTDLRDWRRIALGAVFLFFLGTGIARALWIKLHVLSQVS
jgi:hypothetical protein